MNLGHRITIQSRAMTPANDLGETTANWVDAYTRIAAAVFPGTGREAVESGQNIAEIPLRVFIRYRADVTPQMRVVHAGRNYDITAVVPVAGRRDWLELVCKAGVE